MGDRNEKGKIIVRVDPDLAVIDLRIAVCETAWRKKLEEQ